MKKTHFALTTSKSTIPAILWGEQSNNLILAVHGNVMHKEDDEITKMAEVATAKGYCVLSFDLPQHGDRRGDDYICVPHTCSGDLKFMYDYAKEIAENVSIFACSMGAFYCMLLYPQLDVRQMLFLSPVVDSLRIVEDLKSLFNISDEVLEAEQTIYLSDDQRWNSNGVPLPKGQVINWDYLQYLRRHPVHLYEKKCEVDILFGTKDTVSNVAEAKELQARYGGTLKLVEGGVHQFVSEEQQKILGEWLTEMLFDLA